MPISQTEHHRIAIVGSGFAGLGMAVRLRQDGIDDFVVLERGHDVGGTWRANTYPGAACDVPSRLYSFSFAPNAEWSRSFSPQGEILDYLRDCARRFGVADHIRFHTTVQEAAWDEEAQRWRVRTDRGSLTADVLVSAAGGLSDPKTPEVPGLERFRGRVFHSADWNHEHSLDGERVAVVGTGASAIQIVPAIQPKVAQLDLYQRTPAWIIPRRDRDFTRAERLLYRHVPGLQRVARAAIYWTRELYVLGFTKQRWLMKGPERISRAMLRKQVPDRALRRRLTPSYAIGCKRILISSDFYPALSQPNAEVLSGPIAEVREHSVVSADGVERPTDTIVFATGFHVTPPPVAQRIRGRDGVALAEVWRDGGMQAHRGTTVAGFPNLFLLVGPNTGLGHTSIVHVIESQIQYVRQALRALEREGVAAVEPRREAQDAWNRRVQRDLVGSVWQDGGCASWYLDGHGRNTTLWPGYTFRLRALLREFDAHNYVLHARRPRPAPTPAPQRVALPA